MSFAIGSNRRRDRDGRTSFAKKKKGVSFEDIVAVHESDSDGDSVISFLERNECLAEIDEHGKIDPAASSSISFGTSCSSESKKRRKLMKMSSRFIKPKLKTGPSSLEQHKSLRATGTIECWPADSYSFLAIYSPISHPGYFCFGLSVFVFQILFLIFMMMGQVSKELRSNGEVDNPANAIFASFIPCNVSFLVRATQITAVLSYCVFADSSLKDVVTAVERFPRFDQGSRGDKLWLIAFSCILRFTQGLLAIICTLLLVITSTDVIEIILNFAAVNVISGLDETAFDLAKWGKYGPSLEAEAKRIEQTPIPFFIFRKYQHVRYQFTVIPISVMLFFILGWIVYSQESYNTWVTRMVRIQFQGSTGLQSYSGCYELAVGVQHKKRKSYNRYVDMDAPNAPEEVPDSAAIGYCRDKRQWILFKTENSEDYKFDPCDVARKNELARSAPADSFDISSSYDTTWYSAMGTPLDLYFFESDDDYGDEFKESCNSFLSNGICDESFNELQYQYDGGDCCAYTCTHSNCGSIQLNNAFGVNESVYFGYPTCKDPQMVNITIFLDNVRTSRDRSILTDVTDAQVTEYFMEKGIEFWDEDPVTPLLVVDCDGINVLSIYVEGSMVNQRERIMVKDGATCQISVSNTTNFEVKWDNDPIWWVNYTVYNGNSTVHEIARGYSGENDTSSFRLIPTCYFTELQSSIDISTAYIADDTSTKATNWLVCDGSRYSNCDDNFLIERFALTALNFAAPIISVSDDVEDSLWIRTEQQCRWENIACDGGSVETLAVRSKDLIGTIATSVGLLTGLRRMDYDNNGLTGTIPTEIGQLTNLKGLDIDNNKITGTIPTELGLLVEMLELDLDANELEGTIPTEFGKLTNAREFDLRDNKLSGQIPRHIGFLSNITTLSFQGNKLSGTIPIEVGFLPNLQALQLTDNEITGTIPSEINTATQLELLWFYNNSMHGPIPTEIGRLTNLKEIDFEYNNFSGSIPSEIGIMKSLERIKLRGNSFKGLIPSEIGLLKNLREIRLENNEFTGTIPREVTLIERLRIITFDKSVTGFIPSNVKTLISCNICRDNYYELIEKGDTVYHENDDNGIIQGHNCTSLETEVLHSIFSHDWCKTLNENCVKCNGEIAVRL